jgi:hypothetical protein
MNLEKIKEQVAEEFGATLKLPTKWDYAMKLFYRTKTQLRMAVNKLLI